MLWLGEAGEPADGWGASSPFCPPGTAGKQNQPGASQPSPPHPPPQAKLRASIPGPRDSWVPESTFLLGPGFQTPSLAGPRPDLPLGPRIKDRFPVAGRRGGEGTCC